MDLLASFAPPISIIARPISHSYSFGPCARPRNHRRGSREKLICKELDGKISESEAVQVVYTDVLFTGKRLASRGIVRGCLPSYRIG